MPDAIINIRALDNDTSSVFQRVLQNAEKYKDIVEQSSRANATSGRDYIKLVEEQIKALERQLKIKQRLEERGILVGTENAIEANKAEFEQRKEEILGSKKIPQYLKEERLVKLEKELAKENKGLKDEEGGLLRESRDTFNLMLLALRELVEEGKEKNINDIEEQLREKNKQEEENKNRDKEKDISTWDVMKGSFIGTLTANLTTSLIRNLYSQLQNLPNSLATAQNVETIGAQMWSAIPLVGGALASAAQRHVEESFKQQEAFLNFRALTGSNTYFYKDLSRYGIDNAEANNISTDISRRRGFKGNIESDVENVISMQNGYNLDQGQLMSLISKEGYFKNGGSSVFAFLDLLNKNFSQGDDISSLNRLMEVNNQLLEEAGSRLENIDTNQSASVIAAFRNIGGSFADNRMGQRISSINNSLISPSNDYQQAMNYAILGKLKPGAGLLDIMKAEEGGLQTPGFLKETLKLISDQVGGDIEQGSILTKMRFGLSASSAERLFRNRNKFDDENILLKGSLTVDELREKGIENTSERSKQSAEFANAFSKDMFEGLAAVGTDFGILAAEKLKEWTKDSTLWSGIGEDIADGILNKLGNGQNIGSKQ